MAPSLNLTHLLQNNCSQVQTEVLAAICCLIQAPQRMGLKLVWSTMRVVQWLSANRISRKAITSLVAGRHDRSVGNMRKLCLTKSPTGAPLWMCSKTHLHYLHKTTITVSRSLMSIGKLTRRRTRQIYLRRHLLSKHSHAPSSRR